MGNASPSRPRLPVGGEIFPVYILVGEEISPSLSPNRGIPYGESGIGSPLPSLSVCEAFEVYDAVHLIMQVCKGGSACIKFMMLT
jgi:hypothetical protein